MIHVIARDYICSKLIYNYVAHTYQCYFILPLLIPLTTNLFNKQPIWCSRLYRSNSDNNCTRLWRCTASIIENIKAKYFDKLWRGARRVMLYPNQVLFLCMIHGRLCQFHGTVCLFFRLFVPSWKCYAHLRPQLAKTLFTCGIY